MYRRYRIFQHPWPRILFPIFTIKWKLKPGLVKLIESFLQFCISHEFKIHAFFLFALEVFILRSTAGNWDVKLEAVFKIEAALETASLCWLTSLAPLSLHFDEIFSQAKIIRRRGNLFMAINFNPHMWYVCTIVQTWAKTYVDGDGKHFFHCPRTVYPSLQCQCSLISSVFVIPNYVLHDTLTRLIPCVDIGDVTIVHIPVSLALTCHRNEITQLRNSCSSSYAMSNSNWCLSGILVTPSEYKIWGQWWLTRIWNVAFCDWKDQKLNFR